MHQTIKTVFRYCFALVILLITAALVLTCATKTYEFFTADQYLKSQSSKKFESSEKEQFVLVSNNQKPDNSLYVVIANNGYLVKLNCDHYKSDLCVDEYNKTHTRLISDITMTKIGNYNYISNVNFKDSRTQKTSNYSYSAQSIEQFYKADISNLKFTILGIALFAFAALFVSFRIMKNFKKFVSK
jgi:hypothetical protein